MLALSSLGVVKAPAQVSLLALTETVLAVFICWYISTKINNFHIVIVSSIFAFFVLLRSDQSVRLGKAIFLRYIDGPIPGLQKSNLILASALALSVSVLALTVFVATKLDCVFPLVGTLIIFSIVLPNLFITLTVFMSGSMARVGGIVVAFKRASNFGDGASERFVDTRATATLRVFRAVGLFVFGFGFAFGVFLRALSIRIYATAKYLLRGMAFFPRNWLKLIIQDDAFTVPPIVPGLSVDHYLHPTAFLSRRKLRVDQWAYLMIFFPFIVLPSWIYRLTLKSTFWLYAPVAWIAYIPQKLVKEEDRKIWVRHAGTKMYDWFVFISSLAILCFSLVTAFDHDLYVEAREVADDYFWTPLHLIFAFDVQNLQIWHWVTIPSASLTFLLVIWADSIRKRIDAGCVFSELSTEIRGLLAVNQAKNLFTALWIIVTFWSFLVSAWALGHFPQWMERVARSIIYFFLEAFE